METSGKTIAKGSPAKRPPKGLRQKLEQMLAGITAAIDDGAAIPTPNGPIARADVVARLASGVARYEAIDAHLLALQQARQQLLQEAAALLEDYNGLKDSIAAMVGRRSPRIEQFGMKRQQPRRPLSSEQLLARAVKVGETRRLRHTMGRRQKAALRFRGDVSVSATLQEGPAPIEPSGTSHTPNESPPPEESS